MSKHYVIQVATNEQVKWQTVQHPAGGDWKSRERTKLIAEAAKMINDGETRELRIAESVPVYEFVQVVTPDEVSDAAVALAQMIAGIAAVIVDDDDYIAPTTVCTGCGALDNTACDCVTPAEEDTLESALDKLNETPYYLQ